MVTPNSLPPYQYLDLPGNLRLAYLDVGPRQAPVLLFLHGMGDHGLIWKPQLAALQQHYRCIAVDLPGHGQTQCSTFNCRMFDFAAALTQFIQVLKLPPLTLIGHSMGGQIAVVLALGYAAQIEKLVLIAPAGFEQFTESEKRMLQFGASLHNSWGGTESSALPQKEIIQKSMKGMLDEPVFEHLPQLRQPTLIIFGDHDPFIPNRYLHHQTTAAVAQAGAAQIPNAELHLLKNCGHYPQLDYPQQVNTLLQFFLGE
ncbi:MAG: alpha/beta hydrolase [Hymenobacteraceae bacterium]|nr:alpha/beta hydrolase [Hymenobacteraceae bacterium]MDX5396878.1 alpha/beta hydrolase [Hymenobacteraceae bacterium]MDX5512949.1 alpha/beta hydrolase [Hymenobacteraceae bacterium]